MKRFTAVDQIDLFPDEPGCALAAGVDACAAGLVDMKTRRQAVRVRAAHVDMKTRSANARVLRRHVDTACECECERPAVQVATDEARAQPGSSGGAPRR